jgi:hypothetical protein
MARPRRSDLPSAQVREFRFLLTEALASQDAEGRVIADSKWGIYAFYDYDEEPIYVGQTNEQLRVRIRRHLTNQRTDAVAMRILDPFEVAFVEMWPLWELEGRDGKDPEAKSRLNAFENAAYMQAIQASRFKAILNEVIPPSSELIDLPTSIRCDLRGEVGLEERTHADVRIARRAETIARLAAVARERGEVTDGLRRVLVIQGIRLTYLAADRLAETEGKPSPDPAAIDARALVGTVLTEDPDAPTEEEIEREDVGGEEERT